MTVRGRRTLITLSTLRYDNEVVYILIQNSVKYYDSAREKITNLCRKRGKKGTERGTLWFENGQDKMLLMVSQNMNKQNKLDMVLNEMLLACFKKVK